MAEQNTDETSHNIFPAGQPAWIRDIRDAIQAKHNQVFTLTGQGGDMSQDESAHGMYFHDTCYFNQIELRINGQPLLPLLGNAAHGSLSEFVLSNHALRMSNGRTLGKNMLGIQRTRDLEGEITERLILTNRDRQDIVLDLSLTFGANFKSIMQIRGAQEGKRGALHPPTYKHGTLRFIYDGADQYTRAASVSFSPAPDHTDGGCVTYRIRLRPQQRQTLTLKYELEDKPPSGATSPTGKTHTPIGTSDRHKEFDRQLCQLPRIETSNALFNRALTRSLTDIRMLATAYDNDVFISAGIPWYVALFGRDAAIASYETLAFQPAIARSTLDVLARYQGTKDTPFQDEEPGKILHEFRVGEMANLREIPQYPYYGSVDSTLWFLMLLGSYVRWTGDLDTFRRFEDNVQRALGWADRNARHGIGGFIDYGTQSEKGLTNQGLKDSDNSIVNADGSLCVPPIALVEVQGYAYHARLLMAEMYRLAGDSHRADELERQSADLKQRFNEQYWLSDDSFYGLCLEGSAHGENLSRAIASNPGQALFTGIVDDDKAGKVVQRLMAEDMFNGWGIRTLSAKSPAYNPLDYQVGSVWPHDNALIALGMRRYGYTAEALRVFTGIFEAATHFQHDRLPEVFDGFGQDEYERPVHYPIACSPQAWAAGALPILLQASLGLEADACHHLLRIHRPSLPDWLDWVTVEDLRVGPAAVNLRFERHAETTLVAVLSRQGNLRVETVY